jgi:DNA-binding transcriptional LysR family regulator
VGTWSRSRRLARCREELAKPRSDRTITIAAPPSISDSLLCPLIGAFQTSYPNVRIERNEEGDPDLLPSSLDERLLASRSRYSRAPALAILRRSCSLSCYATGGSSR